MTGESDQVLFNNMRVSGPNKGWRQGGKKTKTKNPPSLFYLRPDEDLEIISMITRGKKFFNSPKFTKFRTIQ